MRFEFATATRIVFGEGALGEVPAVARELGRRALLVTGLSHGRSSLPAAATFTVEGEPTVDVVRRGVEAALEAGADLVIALGGGSAIDAGKAIAALVANGGDVLDYLEVIGKAQPLVRVVRLPHCRLQPANLRRLEIAQTVGSRRAEVPRCPREKDDGE